MNKKIFISLAILILLTFRNNYGMFQRISRSLHRLKKPYTQGLHRLSTKSSKDSFVTHDEIKKVYKNLDALNHAVAHLATKKDTPWNQISSSVDSELNIIKKGMKQLYVMIRRQEKGLGQLEYFVEDALYKITSRAHINSNSTLVHVPNKHKAEKIESKQFEDLSVEELTQKAKELLPKDMACKHVIGEIKRLNDKQLHASEKAGIKSYIKYIFEMPWKQTTKDEKDIKKAQIILDEDHYGMTKVKDHILDEIAVKNVKKEGTMPIICLVGQPGVGKTSIGKSIARALGRKYARVALGGVSDESELRGHRKTYIGSRPGRIVQAIKNSGVANPVMLFDEVDKVSSHGRGDLSAALLEVLDPEQNKFFVDRYLDVPFDLSQVLFVVTANEWDKIAKPLQDRVEKIQIQGYSMEEKIEIAQRYLWPKQLQDAGLESDKASLSNSVIKYIIIHYAHDPGVRQLDRCLRKLARKSVRSLQENDTLPEFNQEKLTHYFGKQHIDDIHKYVL